MLSREPWGLINAKGFHLSQCACGIPMWKQPCSVCNYYPTHYLPSNACRRSNKAMAEGCREMVGDPRSAFKKAIADSGSEEMGYEGNIATFYIRGYQQSCAWNPNADVGRDERLRPFTSNPYRYLTEEQAKFRIELQVLEVKASRIDCAEPDDIFDVVCEQDRGLPLYYGEHFGLARIVDLDMTPDTVDIHVTDMLDRLVGHELIQSRDDFTLTERGKEVHRIYAFERLPRE